MALVAAAWLLPAATPAKHKTTKRHPQVSASASKTSTTAKATPATPAKSHSKTKGKKTRRNARSYQQKPTPDRYKEIQNALASKGYFHGEANGEWGPDSADAIKRFQADQNRMPGGKINSVSLIALGLGPKRLTARSDATPPLPAPTPKPEATQ
jgi:hypothetical protein